MQNTVTQQIGGDECLTNHFLHVVHAENIVARNAILGDAIVIPQQRTVLFSKSYLLISKSIET